MYGYPGATYKDLKSDLQSKLDELKPSIIILMLLTNDVAESSNS